MTTNAATHFVLPIFEIIRRFHSVSVFLRVSVVLQFDRAGLVPACRPTRAYPTATASTNNHCR